jgi:CIC family chloride channel protein
VLDHSTQLPRDWLARLRRSVAGGSSGLTVLALLTGAGAGVGAIAFRYMIVGFTYLFTGHRDYSDAGHVPNPLVPSLGIWFVVIVPVIGGLIYGPLVARFAPEARGHGVPEVMYAVNRLGGRMRPQVPAVKSLASAVCIGAGGSVGREGPIVQIGSALGSVMGQLMRVSEEHLRLLVACGAAGGISATFNAPLAGVFFALELILRNFETRSFGLVVLSSVTADAIGRAAFGSHPFLALPGFTFSSPLELLHAQRATPRIAFELVQVRDEITLVKKLARTAPELLLADHRPRIAMIARVLGEALQALLVGAQRRARQPLRTRQQVLKELVSV